MREILKVLRRFVPPYKVDLILSFVDNTLAAIFGVFSFVMMQPVLEILFMQSKEVSTKLPWSFSFGAIKNNFYFFITQMKHEHGAEMAMVFVCVMLIIAVFLKVLFTYLGSYHSVSIRNGVVRDIRTMIYNKIIGLPIGFFTEERKGDIMSRTTGDVQEVENSIMTSLDMFFKNPILILAALITMIVYSPQMTLFVLILLPIAGGIIGKIGKTLKKTSRRGQDKMGELLSTIEESLSGLRIIKAFNAEHKMSARYGEENNSYRRIMNSLQRRRVLAHPVSEFLGTFVIVIVLLYGGSLILHSQSSLTPSGFIAYMVVFYSIINPAKAFTEAFYDIQKGLAAMNRIDMILTAKSTLVDKPNPVPLKSFEKIIRYDRVRFAYQKDDVIKDVSLEIPKGKTVALVGQSGSGKTTFVELLSRFYDVREGSISIDGIDIRDMKMHDLRNLMGLVSQEPILFNDTFFNNIAFGVEDATMEQVVEAAKVANAHDFISATENGYNTNIGDRGSKMSGGQRQRISIARAVLKNPPILILDEATSALDTESEKLVQDALERLMQNRTSIVIAHRLSTIQNADQICVFQDGEITERGTHEELMQLEGIYHKLCEMQSFN